MTSPIQVKKNEEENLILNFEEVTRSVKTTEGKSFTEDCLKVDDKMTSTTMKSEEILIVEQVTSPLKVKQATSPTK